MLSALALLAQLSLAQGAGADGGDFAALPPADGGTVGEGGAGQDVPEADDAAGRTPTSCRQSIECERGFACVDGRCTWTGVRSAAGPGCLGASAALLWTPLAALGWLQARRRTRERT